MTLNRNPNFFDTPAAKLIRCWGLRQRGLRVKTNQWIKTPLTEVKSWNCTVHKADHIGGYSSSKIYKIIILYCTSCFRI